MYKCNANMVCSAIPKRMFCFTFDGCVVCMYVCVCVYIYVTVMFPITCCVPNREFP